MLFCECAKMRNFEQNNNVSEATLPRQNGAQANTYNEFLNKYATIKKKPDENAMVSVCSLYENKSSNSSSSSLNSVQTNSSSTSNTSSKISCTPYNEYLKKYDDKKYAPVKPVEQKNTVKTEIYVEVNSSEQKLSSLPKNNNHFYLETRTNSNEFQNNRAKISILITPNETTKPSPILPPKPLILTSQMPTTIKLVNNENSTIVTSPPPPPPLPQFQNSPSNSRTLIFNKPHKITQQFEPPTSQIEPKIPKSPHDLLLLELKSKTKRFEPIQNNVASIKNRAVEENRKFNTITPRRIPPQSPLLKRQNSLNSSGTQRKPWPPQSPTFQKKTATNANVVNKVSNSEANVTTVVPVSSDQIDNGAVNKLVYNTYRELLGAYHKKANVVLSSTPGVKVVEGKGVTMQLESLAYVSF